MDIVLRTLLATIMTVDIITKEPILAAIAIPKLELEINPSPPNKEVPKINKATPKLAPELIPRTKGPASGFLNNVCINKPEIDNPEPTKIAVIDFGIL